MSDDSVPLLSEASVDQLVDELGRRGKDGVLVSLSLETRTRSPGVLVFYRGSHVGAMGLARAAENLLVCMLRAQNPGDVRTDG